MKFIVVIIVFDRLDNLKHWLACWAHCNQANAELIVIHNVHYSSDEILFSAACKEAKVKYISRPNVGYDIGAFQDVCRERLAGFPNNWEAILWITDDCWPMHKNFVEKFRKKLLPGIGCVCMEISPYVRAHIRTTGFAIKKETSLLLQFPADPITTKEQCYEWEHRANNTILDQIDRMMLKTVMVETRAKNPLWDTGYHRKLLRMHEHERVFGNAKGDKVTFICPIYRDYPYIISSLKAQTHENWELILVHDGPGPKKLAEIVKRFNDDRILYMETKTRSANWGHKIRKWALAQIKKDELSKNSNFIVITNADNYHVPVFCEYLIKGFALHPGAVATYCSQMVHSYIHWIVMGCRPERGFMDCAGVMLKTQPACEVGWNNITEHSADWIFFEELLARYGKESFVKVDGCLLIHN